MSLSISPNSSELDEHRMLKIREVAAILSISTRGVWRLVASGELPKPARFGRSARWRLSDILAYIEARIQANRNGHIRRPR